MNLNPNLVLSLPLLLTLAACSPSQHTKPTAAGQPANTPVAVSLVTLAMQDWPSIYESTGVVRAATTASIASKILGNIREIPLQVGDTVQQGQLLVSIDARDADLGTRRAQTARQELSASIPELQAAIRSAEASLELANITFQRMQQLFEKRSISNQEFDEATARRKNAQSSLEIAKSRRAQLDSKLAQVDLDLSAAQLANSFTRIHAPFAGRVTSKLAEVGSMAVPGAPLLVLERSGSFQLELQVEETRLLSIRPGSSLSITLDGINQRIEAKVASILPTVDASSRSYTAKVPLPALTGLRSGLFGRGYFTGPPRPTLTIPAAALRSQGQLQTVFISEAGTAQLRVISIGQQRQEQVEVLSGLSAGDRIISPFPAALAEGARIEARQ